MIKLSIILLKPDHLTYTVILEQAQTMQLSLINNIIYCMLLYHCTYDLSLIKVMLLLQHFHFCHFRHSFLFYFHVKCDLCLLALLPYSFFFILLRVRDILAYWCYPHVRIGSYVCMNLEVYYFDMLFPGLRMKVLSHWQIITTISEKMEVWRSSPLRPRILVNTDVRLLT